METGRPASASQVNASADDERALAYAAEVSLAIRGDDFDPDEFTRRIGLKPTSVFRRGEPGQYVERFVFSQWTLSSGAVSGEELSVGTLADRLIETLAEHVDFIARTVTAEDLYAALQIVLSIPDENADPPPPMTFSRETLHFLDAIGAELDVELRFD